MDKHTDIVNHPTHYELAKFECIDVMEEVFGKDALKNYCVIAAFKYLWRCDRKGRKVEDLKKARWYLDKYVELEEQEPQEPRTCMDCKYDGVMWYEKPCKECVAVDRWEKMDEEVDA